MFDDGSVYDLEKQYSPSYWSQRLSKTVIVQEHMRFLFHESICAKHALSDLLIENIDYSEGEFSKYDIFYPTKEKFTSISPVLVYIHGGYWSMMRKQFSGSPYL